MSRITFNIAKFQQNWLHLVCFLLPVLLMLSCTSHYSSKSGGISYNQGQETPIPGERDVLYFMNKGLAAHYDREYSISNSYFEKAELKIEALYARSISRHSASIISNDYPIAYRGEDFENVMINLFAALNYAYLGKLEDALVEARKVDNKLNIINARYEHGQKNVYDEDAFVRFVMGLLYEAMHDYSNALVSYKKAIAGYEKYRTLYDVQIPAVLLRKLLDTCKSLGLENLRRHYRLKFSEISPAAIVSYRPFGEVYFFHYNGMIPEKVEAAYVTTLFDGYDLKIAVPKFEHRPYLIRKCNIHLRSLTRGKTYTTSTAPGEDIGAIAVKNLENRISRITAKAVARFSAKYLAAKGVRTAVTEEFGDLWGLLAERVINHVNLATEKADLRYWSFLPDRIDIASIQLPPDNYDVTIEALDAGQDTVEFIRLGEIRLSAGDRKFESFKTIK